MLSEVEKQSVTKAITAFILEHFSKEGVTQIITHHESLHDSIIANSHETKNSIEVLDYTRLKTILDSTANKMFEYDCSIYSGILKKLHQDIANLSEYYRYFSKRTPSFIYTQSYEINEPSYIAIQAALTNNREEFIATKKEVAKLDVKLSHQKEENVNKKELIILNELKEKLKGLKEEIAAQQARMEALEEQIEAEFKKVGASYFTYYQKKLKAILNTKLFIFNKMLWYGVRKSEVIQERLHQSGIENGLSLSYYLYMHLKQFDEEKINNNKELAYYKKAIFVLGEL